MSAAAQPFESTVGARLAEVAAREPDGLALGDGERRVSYGQLAAQADEIARALAAAPAEGPVAVLMRHGASFAVGVLGAMASGRPCLPLDADHPIARNAQIARHAGAAAVLTQGALVQQARALFGDELQVLDLDALPPAPPVPGPTPDAVAAILYTSGSTGQPKGVYQSHRGVLFDALEAVTFGGIGPEDRLALVYSPTAIAGLRNLLSGLLAGASLELLSPTGLGAAGLAREINRHGLTVLRASPTLFRHVAQALRPGERLDSLRMVQLGGERVDWSDYDAFRAACGPEAAFGCHLGATECWTLHTQWLVDEAVRGSAPRLPVGRDAPGRTVRLLGEDGASAADGETGEIVVSSRHLALGYWREPELTAKAFGQDPEDPAARTYRTGDLGRRRPDGLLEFEGRRDQQIKLHGYRIEPGEVEAALRGCPGVRDAAVVVRRSAAGVPKALVAYAELKPEVKGLKARHLMAMAGQKLPPQMRPAAVEILPELPWLANFKIDRQALERRDAAAAASGAAPADALARQVAEAFEAVLGIRGVGADDNLLSLGGDSLQAVDIALELDRRFGLTVEEGEFEPSRSIAAWAELVRGRAKAAAG